MLAIIIITIVIVVVIVIPFPGSGLPVSLAQHNEASVWVCGRE